MAAGPLWLPVAVPGTATPRLPPVKACHARIKLANCSLKSAKYSLPLPLRRHLVAPEGCHYSWLSRSSSPKIALWTKAALPPPPLTFPLPGVMALPRHMRLCPCPSTSQSPEGTSSRWGWQQQGAHASPGSTALRCTLTASWGSMQRQVRCPQAGRPASGATCLGDAPPLAKVRVWRASGRCWP